MWLCRWQEYIKWRFVDTNFTSPPRKMGHRHRVKMSPSFGWRSSVIQEKKWGDLWHYQQQRGVKFALASRREEERGRVFQTITQTSIKDSLLHHLFPPLIPFAMATEYWSGPQCGCRKKPGGRTQVCVESIGAARQAGIHLLPQQWRSYITEEESFSPLWLTKQAGFFFFLLFPRWLYKRRKNSSVIGTLWHVEEHFQSQDVTMCKCGWL